jgi:hypothetical protein
MRAVVSVLRAAAANKQRDSATDEEILMLRSIRDVNEVRVLVCAKHHHFKMAVSLVCVRCLTRQLRRAHHGMPPINNAAAPPQPKFLAPDVPLFNYILSDLFPGQRAGESTIKDFSLAGTRNTRHLLLFSPPAAGDQRRCCATTPTYPHTQAWSCRRPTTATSMRRCRLPRAPRSSWPRPFSWPRRSSCTR